MKVPDCPTPPTSVIFLGELKCMAMSVTAVYSIICDPSSMINRGNDQSMGVEICKDPVHSVSSRVKSSSDSPVAGLILQELGATSEGGNYTRSACTQ